MDNINSVLTGMSSKMEAAMDHLSNEFNKVRAGKASATMLDGLFVDYYGTSTALSQVANITTPDARTLVLQPWEKQTLSLIEKAIASSNLGLNPQNDGNIIRLNLPPLTEDRRKQLVKQTKDLAEDAKITVRNVRKEGNDLIKKLVKDGTPEDDGKVGETKMQELTDKYIKKIDENLAVKEKEIMTV